MRSRSAYHHGDLRHTLIRTGIRLLEGEGIEALTLRSLAKAAGVSAAAPYRHFQDVSALLAAIAEEGFVKLRESMLAALDDPALESLSAVERVGQGYLRFGQAHGSHLRLMFSSRIPPTSRTEALRSAGERAFRVLMDAIEQARHNGEIDAALSSDLLGASLWSFIHGFTLLLIDGHLQPDHFRVPDAARMARECQKVVRIGWGAKTPVPARRAPRSRR